MEKAWEPGKVCSLGVMKGIQRVEVMDYHLVQRMAEVTVAMTETRMVGGMGFHLACQMVAMMGLLMEDCSVEAMESTKVEGMGFHLAVTKVVAKGNCSVAMTGCC